MAAHPAETFRLSGAPPPGAYGQPPQHDPLANFASRLPSSEKGTLFGVPLSTLRDQALEKNPDVIATACPYCMTMLLDGVKAREKEETVKNLDIAECILNALE